VETDGQTTAGSDCICITYRADAIGKQESLALASMARDDPPASSTAAAMRGKVGSEFET